MGFDAQGEFFEIFIRSTSKFITIKVSVEAIDRVKLATNRTVLIKSAELQGVLVG